MPVIASILRRSEFHCAHERTKVCNYFAPLFCHISLLSEEGTAQIELPAVRAGGSVSGFFRFNLEGSIA
nr:MAG TPA: hypothetical protein [Caudoviricetes sp.]